MYRTILVPLDGSRLAEAALAYARSFAGGVDVRVILIHVADRGDRDCLPLHQAYVQRAAEYVEHGMQKGRRETDSRRRRKPFPVEAKVVVGDPAEAILRWASDGNADLIVMTNDGGSGRRRWLMGGVAGKVLQASNVPILLVHAGISREIAHDKWPHTTLVVILDGSELAESALPHAEEVAKLWSSGEITVSLVRVCEPLLLPLLSAPQIVVKWDRIAGEIMENSRRSAGAYLDGIGKRLRESGLTVTTQVLEGQPAEEILGYAKKSSHSIVVMTTHGRTGIRRWPFGSTAQKVLWGASVPVLLVRPPT